MEKQSHYKRRVFFIDKNFQTKFVLKFCAIVFVSSFIVATLLLFLSRNSTTVTIENTKVLVKSTSDFIFPIVIQTILVVLIFSSLAVVIVTIFTSHKIAGPLYRLKKEIDVLAEADFRRNFSIRGTDQLQELSKSLTNMCNSLRTKHIQLKEKIEEFKKYIEEMPEQDAKHTLLAKIESVKKELDNFKV